MRLALMFAVLVLTSCSKTQKTGQEIRFNAQVISIETYRATTERQFIVTNPHKNLIGLRLTEASADLHQSAGSVIYLAVDDKFLESKTSIYFGPEGIASSTSKIQLGDQGMVYLTEHNGDSGKLWKAELDLVIHNTPNK